MERAMQEMQREMSQHSSLLGQGGVAASTVAGTDYIYGHHGDNATDYNNEDGVNIGANDDDDDIEETSLIMNKALYVKDDKLGDLIDDKFQRGEAFSISNSIADFGIRSNQPKGVP